ncbi:MAG: hypothetical protein AAF125_14285, partial [Chloroflexota bacterium]
EAHHSINVFKIPQGIDEIRANSENLTSNDIHNRGDNVEVFDEEIGYFEITGFANESADLTGLESQIDPILALISERKNSDILVKCVGHATTPGTEAFNETLGTERGVAVADYIFERTADMALDEFGTQVESVGEAGATEDVAFRRVDVHVIERAVYNVAAHEAGHWIGLGDEYEDIAEGRLTGDLPTHWDRVARQLGPDAADLLVSGFTDSIMSNTDNVLPGHYVTFIYGIEQATGVEWTIKE